jgi:phospholipid/cholesterol/gamma-HCH transport system substrate-binding protein
VFVVACLVGTFALIAIFAQTRHQSERVYKANFTDVSGLAANDFVRIAGVEVGKVKRISISPDNHAVVEFSADPSVVLTEGSIAAIRWANPIGDRYLALLEGAGGVRKLNPGDVIPLENTEPALDLDSLLGGFRPLFRALDPEQVNALSAQLIEAFQGEGETIGSFLRTAAEVTSTLADRDELIGQVITNLNSVVGSLAQERSQFAKTVDSMSELVRGLAERKSDIRNAIASTNTASATIADLLSQARKPLKEVITETDRVSALVVADHEYFDNLLASLPDAYKILSRLGIQGDYFTFYLCDAVLKMNGKGGQPVYIKVAGQNTGRCAPK